MSANEIPSDPKIFSKILFEKMKLISPGIDDLELYEFQYALDNVTPHAGWVSVKLEGRETIESEKMS